MRARLDRMLEDKVVGGSLRIRRRGDDGFRLTRARLSRGDVLVAVVRARIVEYDDRVEIVARVRPGVQALFLLYGPCALALAVVPPWSRASLGALAGAVVVTFLGWVCVADFRDDVSSAERVLAELVAGRVVERRNHVRRRGLPTVRA